MEFVSYKGERKLFGLEYVNDPYAETPTHDRPGAFVVGEWRPEYTAQLRDNGIQCLYLNDVRGWLGKDYSFLSQLDMITELDIIVSSGKNLAAIEQMKNLVRLSLTCPTKEVIDFSKLKNLRECFIQWWKGAASILDNTNLEHIYLHGLNLKDYSPLSNLTNLRALTIGYGFMSNLEWLPPLRNLEKLWLLDCRRFTDYSPIAKVPSITNLHIRGCQAIKSLEFVRTLRDLEILVANSGDIETLEPLRELKSLKALSFGIYKYQLIDGDLSVLETLPLLSMLSFNPRRHYTHKLVKNWNWNNLEHPDKLLERK